MTFIAIYEARFGGYAYEPAGIIVPASLFMDICI